MSSLSEVINSTKETLKSRLSHPLLGSFIISWLIFNWKPIFYLFFADDKVVYKLKSISENYSSFETLVYLPFLTTAALATMIPTLSLIYGFFLKFIDYTEVKVQYLFNYKINIIHEKFTGASKSKFDELKKDKELADRNYNRSEKLIETLTPLLVKVDIPESILRDSFNEFEIIKLRTLEFLYDCKDKVVDYSTLEDAINTQKLKNACIELKGAHLINAGQTLHDIQPDTNVKITDDGIIKIAEMKANAFRKEIKSNLD